MADHEDPCVNDEAFATMCRYRLSLVREPIAPYEEPVLCDNASKAARFLEHLIGDAATEHLGALLLDARNRAIGHTIAHVGTLTRTACEPRSILATALLSNCARLLLFHNHPSGDPSPSPEDFAFTRRVAKSAELLGIQLVDHVIVGEDGRYVSLRTRGGW